MILFAKKIPLALTSPQVWATGALEMNAEHRQ